MEGSKVIHVLYSGLGGHGNVVFSLMQTDFHPKHNNVLVFYGLEPTRKEYLEQAKTLGIKTYTVEKRQKKYLKSFKDFKNILIKEEPRSIIVHSSELIVPAVRYSKKNKTCNAYYAEHENNATKSKFANGLSWYAAKFAKKVICLNYPYKTAMIKRYKNDHKFIVIPNGIDSNLYQAKPTKKEGITLGMAARINQTKDHFTLLTAFKTCLMAHPNAVLKIAGDGDLIAPLKAYCNQLELDNNVVFTGMLGETALINFYQSLTICVHATKSETLSTSILQAMACELPIITSSIPNNKLLITENETGWLYEVENANDLALKINNALANQKEGLKLANAARQHVLENYTSVNMAKKYNALICKNDHE